ncbi:MAG: delta-lactam-biosynthetic de-N-acetylase [Pelotomaculum sp.]|uniref:Hypothetical membrane protein n=1 Tax=Pelotomaculum thermopropionicum (strain DSM 13744 / JCM 10971 / SI) TaxID=370438 RepID=A5D513_PELTS|nr:delta-lactam-biosynthetic de-N-acetylase [Pelotomaculum sp.]BAF58654.1 hypothetical membrane protein [Pelotomaculum thermopropionicum SI]
MEKLKNAKVLLAVLAVLLIGAAGYALKSHPGASEQEAGREQPAAGETASVGGTAYPAPEAGNAAAGNAAGAIGREVKPVRPSAASGLSNERRGWGLKRNSTHQQPEMPSSVSSLLSKYDAYWIGSPGEKAVYLTFDEGYENGYTAKILDILKANEVKAAFFVTGHYLKSQPALVRRMVEEGHIVGNHTETHPSLPDLSDGQIEQELRVVEQEFENVTGQKGMRYLRPPRGEYSERTLAVTRNLGYHNIFWSLALVDWVPMPGGPQEAYDSVMGNLHNGALILLHAVSKDNTEALDKILKDAKAQGYTFKTLDDLVAGGKGASP